MKKYKIIQSEATTCSRLEKRMKTWVCQVKKLKFFISKKCIIFSGESL